MPKPRSEMYAPASPFSRPIPAGARLSGVYRQVGIETSVSGATPYDLVKLLLNGYFDALVEAKSAMASGDIALKGRALGRATRIVEEGLKASLDTSMGGEVAQNLHMLYGYISVRLTHANLKNDAAAIDECVQLMTPIREAWQGIASQASTAPIHKEVVA